MDAITKLVEILNISDVALCRARYDWILDGLKFGLTDQRFADVRDAHDNTFKWVFDSQSNKNSSKKLDSQMLEFANNMQDWLASRDGVFQIVGKPGSGKSTLMKFLCQHEQTQALLQEWAQAKKLVFFRYFFWKSGSTMQRSFDGLCRAAVHSILNQCTDLIPTLFPEHWAKSEHLGTQFRQADIENGDVRQVFSRLIDNTDFYKTHRLVVFIDGLDEFESVSDGITDYELVSIFKRWCSKGVGDIKICLSSREYPVFQDGFPGSPMVRLQYLTRRDIQSVIDDFVVNNEQFASLDLEEDRITNIRNHIVRKADGVFLWVVLVLHQLAIGIINGDGSADLFKKVDAIPGELELLFENLLTSIPKADRAYAYTAIRLTIETAQLENHHLQVPLPVKHYMLLDKLQEYGSVDAFTQALVSSWKLNDTNFHVSRIENDLERVRRRIRYRCRGFLEIYQTENRYKSLEPLLPDVYESVKLTHRSAVDFFKDARITAIIEKEPNQMDWLEALCQCVLVQAKLSLTSKFSFFLGTAIDGRKLPTNTFELLWALHFEFRLIIECVHICGSQEPMPTTFIEFLDSFDSLRTSLRTKSTVPTIQQNTTWYREHYEGLVGPQYGFEMFLTDSVPSPHTYCDFLRAKCGIYEYFEDSYWQQRPIPECGRYLKSILSSILPSGSYGRRHIRTLAAICRRFGVNTCYYLDVDKSEHLHDNGDTAFAQQDISIWNQVVYRVLFGYLSASWNSETLITCCLEQRSSDEEMQMWFVFGPQFQVKDRSFDVVFVEVFNNHGNRLDISPFLLDTKSQVVDNANQNGSILSIGNVLQTLGLKKLETNFPGVLSPPQPPSLTLPIASKFKLPTPKTFQDSRFGPSIITGYICCRESDTLQNKGEYFLFANNCVTKDDLSTPT
jgi:hypothetical protein